MQRWTQNGNLKTKIINVTKGGNYLLPPQGLTFLFNFNTYYYFTMVRLNVVILKADKMKKKVTIFTK